MIDRELIGESHPDALLLEPAYFDKAIMGVVEQAGGFYAVCYDAVKCVKLIKKHEKISLEDAQEWFDFNTSGAYVGEHTPVFMCTS